MVHHYCNLLQTNSCLNPPYYPNNKKKDKKKHVNKNEEQKKRKKIIIRKRNLWRNLPLFSVSKAIFSKLERIFEENKNWYGGFQSSQPGLRKLIGEECFSWHSFSFVSVLWGINCSVVGLKWFVNTFNLSNELYTDGIGTTRELMEDIYIENEKRKKRRKMSRKNQKWGRV